MKRDLQATVLVYTQYNMKMHGIIFYMQRFWCCCKPAFEEKRFSLWVVVSTRSKQTYKAEWIVEVL